MNQSENPLENVVRTFRKCKNLSQETLVERIGICKWTIIDIKSTGNHKFEILYNLVRELDLPLYQYSEVSENFELKNVLMQEINNCSEYEMKIILLMVRSLRGTLKSEMKI